MIYTQEAKETAHIPNSNHVHLPILFLVTANILNIKPEGGPNIKSRPPRPLVMPLHPNPGQRSIESPRKIHGNNAKNKLKLRNSLDFILSSIITSLLWDEFLMAPANLLQRRVHLLLLQAQLLSAYS